MSCHESQGNRVLLEGRKEGRKEGRTEGGTFNTVLNAAERVK